MTEPEEAGAESERSEPIVVRPTANPTRVQVPPEGPGRHPDDSHPEAPEPSGPPPQEEA